MSEINVYFVTLGELIDEGIISSKTFIWNTYTEGNTENHYYIYTPIDESPKKIIKILKNTKYFYLKINETSCFIVYNILNNKFNFDTTFMNKVKEIIKTNTYRPELREYGIIPVKLVDMPEIVDIRESKIEIENLNRELNCLNYRISLDYPKDLDTNTIINSFTNSMDTLLLCIFEGNTCISSIQLNVDDNSLSIDSYTSHSKERLGLNKLLRAVSIIIANKITGIDYFKSQAINTTSAYLMIKYFGAVPQIEKTKENTRINLELLQEDWKTLSKEEVYQKLTEIISIYKYIDCVINLNDTNNIQLAREVFTETIRIINCERGTSSTVSIGGKKTKRNRKHKTKRNRKSKRKSKRTIKNKIKF